MTAPTVVSTTPSGTEICYALGVEPAAVSHACDFPPAARDQPVLTRTSGTGSADERYDVDVDLLRRIAPDIIVTQSVCGVCAVDETLVAAQLGDLDVDPEIVTLNAASLADVRDCVRDVGRVLGREERAATVVGQLDDCVDQIGAMTDDVDHRPSVVILEWLDPLRVAGNWVPDLVAAAGGRSPFGQSGKRSTRIDWADLRAEDPDLLIIAPCSLDAQGAQERLSTLRSKPGWEDLSAVRTGQIFALDGNVLSRWTPRLGGELERLAGLCHPSVVGSAIDTEPIVQGA